MTVGILALASSLSTFILASVGTLLIGGVLLFWAVDDMLGAWRKPRPEHGYGRQWK